MIQQMLLMSGSAFDTMRPQAMHDYYKTLGVSRTATREEIRKAYKKIARENHPDVKPDDKAAAERFKQATEAYEVLGDDDKRKQYDQFGAAYRHAGGASGSPFNPRGGSGPIDLSDLFGGEFDLGDLFGGAAGGGGFRGGAGTHRSPQPKRGQDIRTVIQVPFHVSAVGGSHDITLQRGGEVERLEIKVPAGMKAGGTLRLSGKGEPGITGGLAGDLLVTVNVAAHPYFRREGNNVLVDVPLTLTEAALGARIDVPTLTGEEVTLTIPAGTPSGAKLRLKGKGFPDQKTKQPGDQFVVVKIVPPKQLSDTGRELLRQFANEVPQAPREGIW
jgi:curved DNA-binding protein